MLDAYVMIENYCHLLVERVVLIQNNKLVLSCILFKLNFISSIPVTMLMSDFFFGYFLLIPCCSNFVGCPPKMLFLFLLWLYQSFIYLHIV